MSLAARTPYLWHLHADSRFGAEALMSLALQVQSTPQALHYFKLCFQGDGPWLTSLNALAANWRSRSLGLPFGDQGFFMPRSFFLQAGGYDESLSLGEDLEFGVRAARLGMPLRELPAYIASSARRYQSQGWLATTLRHVALTAKLAMAARLKPLPVKGLKPALAAFVKTPGYSPVKTRLAADLGESRALDIYDASLRLLAKTLRQIDRTGLIKAHWNVAEQEALNDPRWSGVKARWAGPGTLAEKLDQTYRTLQKDFGSALLIGADSPQLSLRHLYRAYQALLSHDFVMIPALDGGYVLFGGRKPLPRELWLSVPLSQGDTGARFANALKELGTLCILNPMADLDRAADLQAIVQGFSRSQKDKMLGPYHLAMGEPQR